MNTTITRLAATCVAIAGALLALAGTFAGTASASFRGRDGQIALAPTSGNGIVLVAANGRHPHRICVRGTACRTPIDARWSPDGRQLAVTAINSQAEDNLGPYGSVVYTDGWCANCGRVGGGRVTFTATSGVLTATNGAPASFERVRSDGRWLAYLGDDGRPLPASSTGVDDVADAAWSSQGLLAVVSHGKVKAGRPGRLHAVGTGSSPSWSPDGRRLAVADGGWIVVHPLRGRSTRLARGSSPAWSPDGRSIAYLGPRGTLRIMTLATHRVRVLAGVRGRSVDWGPAAPKARPRCTVASGSSTVLSKSTALITVDHGGDAPTDPTEGDDFYSACLRATGHTRALAEIAEDAAGDVFGGAASAGPFVALVENTFDHTFLSSGIHVHVWNLRTGGTSPGIDRTCPENCKMIGDHPVLGADGVLAVHVTTTSNDNPLYQEQIVSRDGAGVEVRDTVPLPAASPPASPALTGLAITGDALSWQHEGKPQSVKLTPPPADR